MTANDLDAQLIQAIVRWDEDAVCALLAAGANPNVRARRDTTGAFSQYVLDPSALELIVETGHSCYGRRDDAQNLGAEPVKMVECLLRNGADIRNHVRSEGILSIAAYSGYSRCVCLLVRNGAQVNRTGGDATTVLHVAAMYCDAEAVRVLIEYGAGVNAAALDGVTPLYSAIKDRRGDSQEVIETLRGAGAIQEPSDEWLATHIPRNPFMDPGD